MKATARVHMPREVAEKVEYLCRAIPDREWSGVLLYSGGIEEGGIHLRDIIPMDRGSATATEYAFVEGGEDRHADYCARRPEALEWKIGHVHSHNTMPTFFSETDMEELADNSAAHDRYLSLIVNNRGSACAKIAYRGTRSFTGREFLHARGQDGKALALGQRDVREREDILIVHDCEVVMPQRETPPMDPDFLAAVARILQRPSPENTAPAEDRRVQDLIADLFAGAGGSSGKGLSIAEALRTAATESPEKVVRHITENYHRAFYERFDGSEGFAHFTGEIVFILENFEQEYPLFLTEVIDSLIKMLDRAMQ